MISTGNPGLDLILKGGLPSRRLYLLEGAPGSGKTTLALQFLLEGARLGERCLYITLSETREELDVVAASHGWHLDSLDVFEFSAADTCYEFEPTVEDVADALPEELKEMMADPRYEVTVEEEEEGAAAVFRIWINAQQEFVKALKGVVGETEGVDV